MQVDAAILRRFMDDNGLTQVEAAKRLQVSQSSVQRVLTGTGLRTGPARRRMAEALNRIQRSEGEYSSSQMPHHLVEKLARMCERKGDAAVLSALLDAVVAYRRRTEE